MDIVETAMAAGDFDTLVTAVKAAGLVETLKGDGPFTVFAPTDEAFAKIPSDQLNALIADKEALAKVLTYHVVAGKVMASDVVNLSSAKSVQGQSISIDTSNGVKVDNANVIKTDILTSNGVIHVIDSVILPM
ncbi:fasciclin domain-containing protein [Solemya velesiana gill symbiont]|uniref:Fasciclin n=1 Tax=Solemya velesiana gill symbiont TaxID=1918948 RepID=A0A1T2KVU3_9GAMM|nr:fasciclin [Solemya velesiana gill symbiont]